MGIQKILLLLAILAAGPVLAQTGDPVPRSNTQVYKCKNDDGSVTYSESECSKDPKKMEIVDTHNALRTGSGGHQAEISASVADSDCRDNAYRSTHSDGATAVAESNRHIADYQQRQRDLQSQAQVYGNADTDSRKAIDDLDAAIARESEYQQRELANREAAYQNALKACDALRQNAQSPANAPKPKNGGTTPQPAPAGGGGI
jgi:hypothetical protein